MRAKQKIIYWDSCIFIALIKKEDRPNREFDGILDCIDKITRGEARLIVARELLFKEVQFRNLKEAELFGKLMMSKNITIPNLGVRIEQRAKEFRDYYKIQYEKILTEYDSLHLATAIHYKADAFYTFDNGQKGNTVGLLSISGKVADEYPLLIQKPPIRQYRLI